MTDQCGVYCVVLAQRWTTVAPQAKCLRLTSNIQHEQNGSAGYALVHTQGLGFL